MLSLPAGRSTGQRVARWEMMRVRVIPFAELRRLIPTGSAEVWLELPSGSTVADALTRLELATDERLIIGVDRSHATRDTPLHDGAELTLVTPMMGGTHHGEG